MVSKKSQNKNRKGGVRKRKKKNQPKRQVLGKWGEGKRRGGADLKGRGERRTPLRRRKKYREETPKQSSFAMAKKEVRGE